MGDVKSMEEKAKEAAEKENKRRLKRQKKEQKEKRLQTLPEGQSQQLIDKAGPSEQPVRPRKRDPAIDGPAKPEKPVVTQDVVDLVRSIQHGKSVVSCVSLMLDSENARETFICCPLLV